MSGNLSAVTSETVATPNVNLSVRSTGKRRATSPHRLSRRKMAFALTVAAAATVGSLTRYASAATVIEWKVNPETAGTGDTSTSITVLNVNTVGLVVGQPVAGAGIPVGATIATIPDAASDPNSLSLSVATTTTVPGDALAFGTAGAGTWSNTINWVGGVVPTSDLITSIANFDQASYGSFQPNFTASVNINGFSFGDASGQLRDNTGTLTVAGTAGPITITTASGRPNIGDGGIVLNANAGNVTFSGNVRLFSSQVWSNASNSTLTVSGGISRTRDIGGNYPSLVATLNLVNTGLGSIVTGYGNDATGIIAPWMTYADTTGSYYATRTASNTMGGFTTGTAVTDASLASINSATTNYDLNLSATGTATAALVANTVRNISTAPETLQINGSGTLTLQGLMNASSSLLTVAAGPGATGGLVMGPAQETVISPTTANIEIGAAIINPASNNGATLPAPPAGSLPRYNLTIATSNSATPHIVGLNQIVNDSPDVLVISGTMGSSAGGNFLTIGASRNLILNAAAGDIYLGMGPLSNDNDTGSNADLGIQDNPAGPSTVTIEGGAGFVVGLNRSSTFSGGLILAPGASIYIHDWSNVNNVLGTGTITFMGNNTISKYLNTFTVGTNSRINIDGNVTFTGEPLNSVGGGTSNPSMTFINSGNVGYGEVHLGANVTLNTNTPTTVAGQTNPAYNPATIQFGGLFDDGHGYGITKTGTGTLLIQGSSDYGDPQSANFTGPVTVLQGIFRTNQFSGMYITNRDNVVYVDPAGTFYVHGGSGYGQQFVAGFDNGPTGAGTVTADSASATLNIMGGGNYSFSGLVTGSGPVLKDGKGTQTFSGADNYPGATSDNGGSLILDFSGPVATAASTPGQDVLYHGIVAANLSMAGGTLQLKGASGASNGQRVEVLSTSRGSTINFNLNGATALALSAGNITRSTGGTLNFTLPAGTQSIPTYSGVGTTTLTTNGNGVATTASNVNGIMGGFATVNGATVGSADWAVSGATHPNPEVPAMTAVGNQTSASTTILITNTTGISIGDHVTGGGIPVGATVFTISPNVSITLNTAATTTSATNTLTIVPAAQIGQPGSYDDGTAAGFPGTALCIYTNAFTSANVGESVSFNAVTGTAGITAGQLYYIAQVVPTTPVNFIEVVPVSSSTTPVSIATGAGGNAAGALSIDVQGSITALGAGGYTAFNGATDATNTNLQILGNATLSATETINSLKINPSAAGQSLSLGSNNLVIDALLPITGGAITATQHVGGLLFTGTNDYQITGTGAVSANGGDLVINQFSTGTLTISALITNGPGTTTLTKVGPGKLVLTGANTFTGAADLYGGVVEISSLQALGNGTAITFSGSTLRYGAGFSGSSDVTTTAAGTAGRTVSIAGNGVTVDTNGNNATWTNIYGFQNGITGNGGLTKIGLGTLTLDNNYVAGQSNGYTGPTIISGGTLAIGPDALLVNGGAANQIVTGGTNPAYNSAIGKASNAPSNLVLDGGTLQYLGAATSTDHNFTLTQNSGTIDSSNASNAALVFSNTSNIATTGSGIRTLTLTGSSTGGNTLDLGIPDGTGGATSVIKNGTGTWLLNGTSTYTGTTIVNSGTLGGSGTLASTVVAGPGPYTIAPSATLAPTAATKLTVGGLTTSSNTTLNFNLVTPNTVGGSDQIAVTGALNISGGGTLAFTNHGVGQPSLGYYKIMSYGSLTGSASNLTLPPVANNIVYTLDLNKNPGFVDVHRGFEGDANDDGVVNGIDLGILAGNFFNTNMNWTQGDFNGDGVVNGIDLGILAGNFFGTVGAFSTASASSGAASGVPEPASLLLLGAGLVGVLGTRRRVRKS